jgi:enoyl-CoA hydratase/carnithine racemase
MSQFATYEKSGRVALITLNRPESRNAIATIEDCDDIAAAFNRAQDDEEISVAIITGAGQAFCSGGDLKSIRERSGIGPSKVTPEGTRRNYRRGVHTAIKAIAECEVVTIAAINGSAIGLGLDVAAACDMRVIGESAKVASSFVKVGLIPGDGGAYILNALLGKAIASQLIFTGDPIDAAEALRIGLANKIAPDDKLMDETRALAARVAVNPPRALRMSKRLMIEAQHSRLSDVLELWPTKPPTMRRP